MISTSLTRAALISTAALTLIAPSALAGSPAPAAPAPTAPVAAPLFAPAMKSAAGITVNGVVDVTPDKFDVLISSAEINPSATRNGLGIRVLLPTGYATSNKRYPVIYLLHGAGGSDYTFMDKTDRGVLETVTADNAIVVMPDGGKNGWYTNWVQGTKQNWKTFHNDQLVPFIDANLRTIATREGRAIAGLSMGGFGAMRYAGERPDLYKAVASMSGALNIQLPQFTGTVMAASASFNMDAFGAFGSPMWPFNGAWVKSNPVNYASRYNAVKPYIFVGAKNEIAEMAVRQATYDMVNALKKAKVPHYFENIGLGGPTAGGGNCTGGHETDCLPFVLPKVFPMLLDELADPS